MVARKRGRQEMEENGDEEVAASEPTLLQKIRNMWEFACLMQFLFLFGKAVKIEDVDVDDFEEELLRPERSQKLSDMALALLKVFSSHRPLNLETFDEVTRRQYNAKAPHRPNPFGNDEEPHKFTRFDVYTKIRVLQQLSTWTFNNPNTIREKMPESDSEHTNWRIEPFGWDSEDRVYFLLDDDRLYRRTEAPLPPAASKSRSKSSKSKGGRSNKRRRVSRAVIESSEEDEEKPTTNGEENGKQQQVEEYDSFGGMKWELLAITLDDYNNFLDTIRRSKDPNEKALRQRLIEDVLPIIEKRAEQNRAKEARRMKELENLQKLATAKRSSRLADKAEKRKEVEDAEEAERKHQAELQMAHKEQDKQRKLEEARESRMMTREQRLKDREVKRILHEEELKKLEEEQEKAASNEARISERHLKAEMERRQKELEKIAEDEDWTFDCSVCGMHGQNLDDGSHSIACDRCNIWQHSACHGIKETEAERDDFHFVCATCKRREEKANQPKIPPLKFRFSDSPKATEKTPQPPMASNQASARHPSTYPDQARKLNGVYVPYQPATNGAPSMVNGYAPQSPRQHVSPQQARPGSSGSSFPMTAPGYSPQQHHSPPRQQYPGGVLQWQPPQTTSASHWSHQLNGYSNGVPPPSSYPPIGNFGRPTSGSPPNTNSQQHRPSSQHSVQGTPANARPFYASSPLQQNGHPPPTLPPPSSASASVMTPRTTADMIPGAPFSQQSRTPGSSLPPLGQFGKSPSNLFGPSRPSAHSPIMPGLSPAKQESPRPSSSHSTLTATPVIPPVATLSPSFGNVQSMSPPTKKAAPDHLPENGEVGSRNR